MTEIKVSQQKKKILLKAATLYTLSHQAKELEAKIEILSKELLDYAGETKDYDLGQYRAYEKAAPAKLFGLPENELKKVQELLLLEVPKNYVGQKPVLKIAEMYENFPKDRKLKKCLSKHKVTIVKNNNLHLKAIG